MNMLSSRSAARTRSLAGSLQPGRLPSRAGPSCLSGLVKWARLLSTVKGEISVVSF